MAQYFSFAKEENMVQRCVAFGCSNTKDEIKGISIHQIPFYGDTRSEAVKRRGKWISFLNGNRKHWTPSKYSVGSELKRLNRVEIGVLPVSQFYRPNVYLTSHTVVASSALALHSPQNSSGNYFTVPSLWCSNSSMLMIAKR